MPVRARLLRYLLGHPAKEPGGTLGKLDLLIVVSEGIENSLNLGSLFPGKILHVGTALGSGLLADLAVRYLFVLPISLELIDFGNSGHMTSQVQEGSPP